MLSTNVILKLKKSILEIKIVYWIFTILLSPIFLPLLFIFAVSLGINYSAEYLVKKLNNFRMFLLKVYCWFTKMPYDGKRGTLRFIDIQGILKNLPAGTYKAEVFDPKLDKLVTIDLTLLDNGVIDNYSHFNKLNVHDIRIINGLNVRGLLGQG